MTLKENGVSERNQDVRSYASLRNYVIMKQAQKKRLRQARRRRNETANEALRQMIHRQK